MTEPLLLPLKMLKVKVPLSGNFWFQESVFIHDGNKISITDVARMLGKYREHVLLAFQGEHEDKLILLPYNYAGGTRYKTFITLGALEWYLTKFLLWEKNIAMAAMIEIQDALNNKLSAMDKEASPPQAAAAAEQEEKVPFWWPRLVEKVLSYANPSIMMAMVTSEEIKNLCLENMDEQVQQKVDATFDAGKEEQDILPGIRKHLREECPELRQRVEKKVKEMCAQEKMKAGIF
ncbi:MAG: hypothetical protein K2Q45_07090 [Nitrosomonas sp.]|nr:hypothetical protein [Nitrosomonas sp.]